VSRRAGATLLGLILLVAAVAVLVATVSPSRGQHRQGGGAEAQASDQCGSSVSLAKLRLDPAVTQSLANDTMTYCTQFSGRSIPAGWMRFSGVPGGDPSGLFVPSHVTVANGYLTIIASQDPAAGGTWATGGICQCAAPRLYGAFFVHSRVTSAGPDEIDLLWPSARVWPPEVDFNESVAESSSTTWSVHWGATNHAVHGYTAVNLTQWHTFGVIWTPTSLVFTVDGRVWGDDTVGAQIPHQAMTLDISQQTFCGEHRECPTRPVAMHVDWVAEFTDHAG
jgi:hypothetical protein